MVLTKKNNVKRRRTRKFKNITPANMYHNFQRDVPILNTIFKKYPSLFNAMSFYKGNGYRDINGFLKKNEIKFNNHEDIPKDIFIKKPNVHKIYETCLNNSNKHYCKLLCTIEYIQNLFTLFDKYIPHQIHPLPRLYRGITQSFHKSINEPDLLQTNNPISIPYFQSCTKSYQMALGFQGCSMFGPCCMYILHVSPDVHYIPMYWWNNNKLSETYNYSEYEILLEPFVEYKLRKMYKKEFSASEMKHCKYDNTPSTFQIDVYEIDVLPPPKGSRDTFYSFYKKIMKQPSTIDKYIDIKETIYTIKLPVKKDIPN